MKKLMTSLALISSLALAGCAGSPTASTEQPTSSSATAVSVTSPSSSSVVAVIPGLSSGMLDASSSSAKAMSSSSVVAQGPTHADTLLVWAKEDSVTWTKIPFGCTWGTKHIEYTLGTDDFHTCWGSDTVEYRGFNGSGTGMDMRGSVIVYRGKQLFSSKGWGSVLVNSRTTCLSMLPTEADKMCDGRGEDAIGCRELPDNSPCKNY